MNNLLEQFTFLYEEGENDLMVKESRKYAGGCCMAIEKSNISPFFVIFLMFLSVLSPITGFTIAGGGQGNITTFADGNYSMSLMLNGGSTNSDSILALERNSTINNAIFEISYSTTSPSPGDVTLDIGNDSQYEWAWNTIGYGNLGAQTEFATGLSSTSGGISSTGNIIGDISLPSQGQIQYAEMYADFSPDYGGGFVATGVIDSLVTGDTDGDGLPEPVFLQRAHSWANGSISPAVGTFDWSSANGFSAITWYSICDGAGELVVADFNGDGLDDVASFDSTNASACMLFTQSNGSWGANTNQSLGMGASGIDSGDMDGDGDYELISIHSDGNLREFVFNTQNGSFGLGAESTVSANGTGMQATLGALAVGKFWGSGNDTVVVADAMDGHVTMWNITQGNWIIGVPGSSFDCIKSGMTTLDWNGDGLLDVLGNTDMGVCTATFNGTGWSTNQTNATQLNNYSIGDWNGDGSSDILQPLEGNNDGNDATPTGYLQVRPFGVNGTISSTSRTIFPHTAPKHVILADMDGDGLSEHLVVAGESTKGIFIAGWHTVSLDFDMDNNPECDLIGYAGDGQNGVDKLNWTDVGNISLSLSQTFSQIPSQVDLYGTEITTIRPMGVSIGDGIVTLSDMNITYDATFTVDSNPSAGNLSNLLNSMMVPGSGTFNVTLPISSSSSSGALTLESVAIDWVAGMANQVYRDAPIIQNQIVFWDGAENEHVVVLFWDDLAINEADFLSYQLFRWESGTTPNLNIPYESGIPQNMTFDNASLSGKSWDFVVRTIYQNGVYSNYSSVVNVVVPPAQSADLTAPDAVAFVNAIDVGGDEGGAIFIEWPISVSSDIAWYALYEDTSPFSTISGQNEIANFTVYDDLTSHIYSTAADGVNHYFGVVVGDLSGNVNWAVTASAPAFSQNNSVRTSVVSLLIETDGVSIPVEAIAGNPLAISGQITSMGEAVAAADYSIVLTPIVQFSAITIEGVTDANGNFNHQWNDWLDFESQYSALRGDITVEITYNGGLWVDSQELTGSTASDSFTAKTAATLSLTPAILQLGSGGQGVVSVSLIADNAIEQSLLTGTPIEYHIGNESNQATGDSGSVPINNDGLADISISYLIGGEIDVNPLAQHTWLVLTNGDVRAILLPPSEADEPNGNETEEITELVPLTWSCEDSGWEITVNASSVTNICTIENLNPMLVHVEVLISSLSNLEISAIPSSASMFSNSSKDIQITLRAPLGTSVANYSIDVDIIVSAAGYTESNLVESILVAVLSEQVVVDGNDGSQNDQADNNPSSAGMSSGMIGGIVAAIIAILLVGFVVLRKPSGEDEDDDLFDEYDEYGVYSDYDEDDEDDEDDEPQSKKRSKPKALRTPAKMREKPQEWAMDESGLPHTGSKAGTRPSSRKQKPKPLQMSSNESDESEEQYDEYYDEYEEENDYTQSDDYKVDEEGVEWWKDELNVWWYRYPDEDEWSEFIE